MLIFIHVFFSLCAMGVVFLLGCWVQSIAAIVTGDVLGSVMSFCAAATLNLKMTLIK